MKLITVIGARPQFIKAAAVSRKLQREHQEILVHTGQHYDKELSSIFFEELKIPNPAYNLGVGSNSHGRQTAEMLIGIEDILKQEKPDAVLVYGDTNSTLAGTLAASKLHIPVFHVEAGLRSYNRKMPEEQNRIVTDHLSSLLFCPTPTAVENLKKEGIEEGVYDIGDVMCDAVQMYAKEAEEKGAAYYINLVLESKIPEGKAFYLATIHRAENTDTPKKLDEILKALEELENPVLFPVHPRSRELIKELKKERVYTNVYWTEPVGYLEMLFLVQHAKKIITDSGGLQKEAYLLGTPCITVRDQTEWVETLRGNHNILAKPRKEDLLKKIRETKIQKERENYYGTGDAAEKLCERIRQFERKI